MIHLILLAVSTLVSQRVTALAVVPTSETAEPELESDPERRIRIREKPRLPGPG
jgi:hypothetical protein